MSVQEWPFVSTGEGVSAGLVLSEGLGVAFSDTEGIGSTSVGTGDAISVSIAVSITEV